MKTSSPWNRFATTLTPLSLLAATPTFAAASTPAVMHNVIFGKADGGYCWKVIEARDPVHGDDRVLIRVRAVTLNRVAVTNRV